MSEHTVHDECDTNHVSTIFKDRQEEEQDCHLWHETKYCSKATDDTINNKSHNHVTGADCRKCACCCILNCYYKYIICPVCYKGTDCCYRNIIYDPHYQHKDWDSEESVRNDTVNLVRSCKLFFSLLNSC